MIDCKIDKIMLNNNAVQNESTANPPTILEHKSIISALITNKNKPKVRNVTGIVKNTIIGLMNVFSKPRTTATISEVVKLATVMPDMKCEINSTKIAVESKRKMKFMMFSFSL